MRLDDGSRMNREVHVRFCESAGLKYPAPLTLCSAETRVPMQGATPTPRALPMILVADHMNKAREGLGPGVKREVQAELELQRLDVSSRH
jgi:hypothetical protein